jgi:hypothetical protein
MPSSRRFPPPWSIEDIGAAFVVKGGAGKSWPTFHKLPRRLASLILQSVSGP